MTIHRATIVSGDDYDGQVWGADGSLRDHVCLDCAGIAAEALYFEFDPLARMQEKKSAKDDAHHAELHITAILSAEGLPGEQRGSILQEAYDKAYMLVTTNADVVEALALELLRQGTLTGEEVRHILAAEREAHR